jgi:hypothetical protein
MEVPIFWRLRLSNESILVVGGTQLVLTTEGMLPVRDLEKTDQFLLPDGKQVSLLGKECVHAMLRLYKLVLDPGKMFLANGVTAK